MSEIEARPEAPQPRPETTTPAGGEPAPSSGGSDSGDVSPAGNAGAGATAEAGAAADAEAGGDAPRKRRRRGSRGGRKRSKTGAGAGSAAGDEAEEGGDPGDPEVAEAAGEAGANADVAGDRAGRNSNNSGSGRNSRSSRGGRGNGGTATNAGARAEGGDVTPAADAGATGRAATGAGPTGLADDRSPDELPDPPGEGRASVEAAERALVRKAPAGAPSKPKIGDTMPAPPPSDDDKPARSGRRGRRGGAKSGRGNGDAAQAGGSAAAASAAEATGGGGGRGPKGQTSRRGQADQATGDGGEGEGGRRRRRRRGGRGRGGGAGDGEGQTVEAMLPTGPVDLDDETLERRRGRERKGRPVGRYMMCVHVAEKATQIAVLEGRALIEHYVSRPSDDISQIHGNVYLGRVQNVLPGMEAAFVDIGTPKNAVLYRGDIHYDQEDVDRVGGHDKNRQPPRIEQMLRAGQTILCQVTKNPIGAKGARLTQEVSLPGRFVVLIPNSSTYGISKRLSDDERKRLRTVLDRVKPAQHGIIVRTAAEGTTSDEIENDVRRLLAQWQQIDSLAKRSKAPKLLYREPDMAVRVIREEFNKDYRGVVIDDRDLYEQVRDYVGSISPTLADRVEFYDPTKEKLPLFERHHVHEQLHRALDRKVWLPSGGSLIIEHTEALTVIDVNTGKNVGKSSLEETVFKNNLEAAVEIARQLRLRDIGGIIVVDFIDMERRDNRDEVAKVFRDSLSRDKTRTQVFEISELGLCEMTRKRIGEGLLESFSGPCPVCEGRGVVVDKELLPD